jgi:transglutaminase-like putative cysteine protease
VSTLAPHLDAAPLDVRGNHSATTSRPTETIPATVVLTALSIITAIGFCRLFDGWEFLGPMMFVVIGVHVLCLSMRLLNTPGYIAVPASVVLLFALIAWKYYPSTLSGPFPTSTTWRFISTDMRLAREQFPSATAPVAAIGGFVVAATTAAGIAALLSDAFAFRAYGRAEAAVPTAVLFVFASALGVDNHRVLLTALWLAAALAVIAALRLTHSHTEQAWIGRPSRVLLSVLPLAAALAASAGLGGAFIGPALPGAGEKGLVDTHDKSNVTQVLSPLVDIRSRLINLTNVELFTVTASEPHYWRATGLSEFNGTIWGIPDSTEGGNFPTTTPQAGSRTLNQDVHILGLAGPLLPAAFSPQSVVGGNAFYVPATATLVEPGVGLRRNANYQIVSTVLNLNPNQLRAATSNDPPDSIELHLPSDFPTSVSDTAREITAGAPTVYDKAIALEQWFRTNFEYSLAVQRGHSDDALENFLRVKRGYCEQFSAAFAAMARSLGIPARVAVGFTYGDLGEDNKYHVYGRNAHAWPEVWFDDIGWVSFEPTPGRGEPGTEAYTGYAAEQASSSDSPDGNTPETVPAGASVSTVPGTNIATSTTVAEPKPGPAKPIGVEPPKPSGDSGLSTTTKVILLIFAAAGLWALLLPRIMRIIVWRHPPSSPTEQIEQSWQSAARALGMLNLAPTTGETPLEHAHRAERMTGLDRRTLRELALCATAAIYGHIGDKQTAARCALLSNTIVTGVKQRLNFGERIAARFNPRRAGHLIPR